MERIENIPGGYKLIQKNGLLRLGTDTVLLSGYPKLKAGMKVCDLGCGTGALQVLMAARREDIFIDGIEILDEAVEIATRNIKMNGLSERVRVKALDLRNIKDALPSGYYDLTVSNPPYFENGRGKSPGSENLKSARSDINCTISDICSAAAYLTRWGGRFAVVFRPERLVDMLFYMRENALEPKRIRFVKDTYASEYSLVLIEAKRGGNKGLKVETELILHNPDGGESEEMKKIYMRDRITYVGE